MSSVAVLIPGLRRGTDLVSSETRLMLKQHAEPQPKYLRKRIFEKPFGFSGACFMLCVYLASECRMGWERVIFWGLCRARSLLNTAIMLSSLVRS